MKIKRILSALIAGVVTVSLMTISSYAEDTVLFEGEKSCAAWGQAWEEATVKNDGGTFDPEVLQSDSVIYVTYSGSIPELVFQSWSGGEGWAKIAPNKDDGSVALFTYDDIVSAYKSNDFTTLDKIIVGATDSDTTITKVVLGSGSAEDASVENTPEETSAEEESTEEPAIEESTEEPAIEETAVETATTETATAAVETVTAGNTNTATTATKGSADTGIEGIAVVLGLAVVAAGAVVISKKSK